MTATTPIYGLSYPEGSDLVSTASASFKAMADTFEQALDQVDRRSTPQGAKPVIATTLNTLATLTGVTGQTGYVTDDGDNTGMYVWTGTSWLRIVDSPMIEASTTLTKITTDSLYATVKILDQGINCIGASNTALLVAQIEWVNNGQFQSEAWKPVDLFEFSGYKATREAFGWCFDNNTDGSTTYNAKFKCVGKRVSWVARGNFVVAAKCWHQGGIIIPVTKTTK